MVSVSGQKTVVVLGLRSGTSLLVSMLQDIGIYAGSNLKSSTLHNKHGHFEERDIKAENDDMLVALGKTSPHSIVSPEELDELPFKYFASCKQIINKHRKDIWTIKNPMLVWTVPVWDMLLDNPHYILCTRDPESNKKSLVKMNEGKSIPEGWIETYWDTAQKHLEGKKYMEVDFDEMIDSPHKTLEGVLRFLEYKPWGKDFEKAMQRVDKAERHFEGGK